MAAVGEYKDVVTISTFTTTQDAGGGNITSSSNVGSYISKVEDVSGSQQFIQNRDSSLNTYIIETWNDNAVDQGMIVTWGTIKMKIDRKELVNSSNQRKMRLTCSSIV